MSGGKPRLVIWVVGAKLGGVDARVHVGKVGGEVDGVRGGGGVRGGDGVGTDLARDELARVD